MKRSIRDWKAGARAALQGKYIMPILGMLAVAGITFLGNILTTSLFPGGSISVIISGQVFFGVLSLIMCVFSAGLSYMYLNIARGREHSLRDLLFLFKNHPDRVIVAGFVMTVIDLIVSIPYYYFSYTANPGLTLEENTVWLGKAMALLILASVLNMVLTLPFVLSYYLMADDLELGGIQALKVSAQRMKGKMGKYLLLQISFIPWMFLSVFTLYIGLLWLLPYMEMSSVMFYRDLCGELDVVPPQEPYGSREILMRNPPEQLKNPDDDYNSEA